MRFVQTCARWIEGFDDPSVLVCIVGSGTRVSMLILKIHERYAKLPKGDA